MVDRARYLLDTDTCSYIQRNRPIHVRARFQEAGVGTVGISPISFGELLFGAYKSNVAERTFQILRSFIELVPVFPLPADAPDRYGQVRSRLSKSGTLIGANDLWIAAHALASDLILVTNNEREFRRVDGLRIENWTTLP